MLNSVLAKRFIEKVGACTNYIVSIMDEKGIIIASKIPSRLGTFHEIAFRIISGDEETVMVENENTYVGVKRGVNMAVRVNNKKVGVVAVIGQPAKVQPIAFVIKLALETMLEQEMDKTEKYQRSNQKEQFLMRLLAKNDMDESELSDRAAKIGIDGSLIRVPIYVQFAGRTDLVAGVMNYLLGSKYNTKQDIACDIKNDAIIIFKMMEGTIFEILQHYKFTIGEYIDPLVQHLEERKVDYYICIGSFQSRLSSYAAAYNHCQWLSGSVQKKGSVSYFYDYVGDYFHSVLPMTELNGVFSIFKPFFSAKTIDTTVEVIDALNNANFNLAKSSRALFLHKNTMTYRFNKIREMLGIDPMEKANDREFMSLLNEYLKTIRKFTKDDMWVNETAETAGEPKKGNQQPPLS